MGAARRSGSSTTADEALASTPTIEAAIVVKRLGHDVHMTPDRDFWWHDIVDRQSEDCPPVPVESEHMLYLLYTSGTTAKPKGILHTTAGYLLGTSFTIWAIFDVKPDDVYWCAADIGWVTVTPYITARWPTPRPGSCTKARRIRRAGTAGGRSSRTTRSRSYGAAIVNPGVHEAGRGMAGEARPLVAAEFLGSVGEPMFPAGVALVPRASGGNRARVVDTWWQTETCQTMITPLPG